uniref:ferroxidase n=1 Tax=Strigops habroptila TaxID=2489341 RepID=A0A672UC11_STRHB
MPEPWEKKKRTRMPGILSQLRGHVRNVMESRSEGPVIILLSCVFPLEENADNCLLLHKLATEKNDPHLCDFIETHYLDEQVKAIKELGDHVTNLRKMGAPKYGMAEYLFDKNTLGDSDHDS